MDKVQALIDAVLWGSDDDRKAAIAALAADGFSVKSPDGPGRIDVRGAERGSDAVEKPGADAPGIVGEHAEGDG